MARRVHKHSLTCVDTDAFLHGKGLRCTTTGRQVVLPRGVRTPRKWPTPPTMLLDLFRQSGKDMSHKTLQAIQKFIGQLPLKDERDNARAAAHYRMIAASHGRGGQRHLADAFYEIANQLWN